MDLLNGGVELLDLFSQSLDLLLQLLPLLLELPDVLHRLLQGDRVADLNAPRWNWREGEGEAKTWSIPTAAPPP